MSSSPGPLPSTSSAPLRVCVDLTEVRPGGETGGAKYMVFEFLRHIGEKHAAEFQWVFVTSSANHHEIRRSLARMGDELVCLVKEPVPVDPPAAGGLPSQRACFTDWDDLLLERRIDLFYFPFGKGIARLPGIPAICLIVDLLHRDYPFTLCEADRVCREAHFEESVRTSDFFQCISHFAMQRLHEEYGVPRERIFNTYIPIQQRLKASAEGETGGAPQGPFFYYPANFWPHKNHEVLLLAYRLYARRNGAAAWPLVLTGYVDRRTRHLEELARILGIDSLVHFKGYVAEAELDRLWRSAGAMVFPSLHEGFGIPLVEAMHYGVPIVAGKIFSAPEICGEACLYTDVKKPESLADAMQRLAGDGALRKALADEGTRRLTLFRFDHEVNGLVEILRKAAAGWARPHGRGIEKDGWIRRDAVLALPKMAGRVRLSVSLDAELPAGRLVCWAGTKPLGSFDQVDLKSGTITARFLGPERNLRLRVLRRTDSPEDQGVRIREIALSDEEGRSHVVWPLKA